jgi:ubiquinone/menaquinone biosynthesis C-methylase UbiE
MRRLWWAFLRLFFRLLYNEFAWTYDWVAWVVSLGQWKAWGRTTIPHLEGKRVLDLAHGPGHLLVALREQGFTPVGVDLSPYMGGLARRRLVEKGSLTVPLVRARAQALPFRDGCIDSVVSTFPAEFIMARETLRESARVLSRDGRMVIAAMINLAGGDLVSRFIRWLYRITGQGERLPQESEARLRRAGFVLRVVWETVGQSQVMLVVAERRR